jgi:hypothetical protein
MTRHHLAIATLSVLWLLLAGAFAWTTMLPPPTPLPDASIGIEHQKLQRLLTELLASEKELGNQLTELDASSTKITSDNIYQGIDISKIDGIRTARERAAFFGTQMDQFGAALEASWVRIGKIVHTSDLDEPLDLQLREQLSLDEVDVYPKYRAWISAAHQKVEAIHHYLNVSEQYLGQFTWRDNKLVFANPRAAADIGNARAALSAAEEEYDRAARAVTGHHAKTTGFVGSAMKDLEKYMTPRDNVEKKADGEKNPP